MSTERVFFLLPLVLTVFIANGDTVPSVKPGCTPVDPNQVCITFNDRCKDKDENCLKGQICCGVICGNACSKPNICTLPKLAGPCKALFRRWYYDVKSGKCRKFIYGGCGGNANNFSSKKECKKATRQCACLLNKDPGSCSESSERYYFNFLSKSCEKFTYNGCKGNKNNFKTKQSCEKRCGTAGLLAPKNPQALQEPLEPPQFKCGPRGPTGHECGQGPGAGAPCSRGFFCGEFGTCCHYCKYGTPHKDVTCSRSDPPGVCPPGYYCEAHPEARVTACCPSDPDDKPGVCPTPWPSGTCSEECKADKDCHGNQKCCYNGCGHVCLEPLVKPKPGVCPAIPDGASICADYCSNDDNCPGTKKCCSHGCGKSCQDGVELPKCEIGTPIPGHICGFGSNTKQCPFGYYCKYSSMNITIGACCQVANVIKPGFCPSSSAGVCITTCKSDADCSGSKKCCKHGCGQSCVDPVIQKPGVCPVLPPGSAGHCAIVCKSDLECPGSLKCCSTGCGRDCTRPEEVHLPPGP